MPTTLPRYTITNTPEIAAALDEAARRWEDEPPSRLLKLALQDWADSSADARRRAEARAKMVGTWPGATGGYNRVDDWPAFSPDEE